MVRTGIGFDAHKLVVGRKLILGGIEIDFDKGLLGHSDADVICHAIADALLGAAGFGDIGMMFPNSEPVFKDISSLKILSQIEKKLKSERYKIINIDVTVIAQEPKIAQYIDRMKKAIADSLSIEAKMVSIKGKTTETLGFTGRKEGMAALAVATVEKG
jgi:2-C-methyl-D-erythritol 2,4-cyclodiphosphate synthase